MNPTAEVRQSKKTVTIILVITGILALASVVIGYYYLQLKDLAPKDSRASNGCACYFVAATDSVKNCASANTKMAYEFRTGQTESNNNCSAICDVNTAAATVETAQTVLSCKISDFPIAPGCVDISVENQEQKRYANTVPIDQTLDIKAKFTTPSNATVTEDYYTGFSFLINGQKKDITLEEASSSGAGTSKEYIISTQLKDYSQADSITIQAIGKNKSGDEVTSNACNRVLSIQKEQVSSCTQLNAEVVNDTNGTPKVNELTISTSFVENPSTLSVKFTAGKASNTLTTKNISAQFSGNRIVLDKAFLYNKTNFTDIESFSILDNETGSIGIEAEVYVNGQKIQSSSCTGNFTIPSATQDSDRTTTDDTNTNNDNTNTNNDSETEEDSNLTDVNTSNFSVSKSSSVSCVERVTPSNSVNYTITISNNDSETEEVVRIEDKLPLGFTYTSGSTYVDGQLVDDDTLIDVTTVGSSQQITFDPSSNWSVGSNEEMTIRYNAKASASALSGNNLNEVVVVPVNNPVNSSSLRTSNQITVAQNCSAPQTGLFDTTISRVILSLFIIFVGTFIYFSQSGIFLSEKLLASSPIQSIKLWKLKNDNPKKYFEDKFINEIEKGRRD